MIESSSENGSGFTDIETREEEMERKRKEKPPEDDCCPICFGDFTVSCRTNCGHWFCGNCILQLWMYRGALRACKCPICTCSISKLTPEASLFFQQEKEVVDLLKGIQQYNRLYLLLGWIYRTCEFDFIPTGRLGIYGLFDTCAVIVVVVLFFAGLYRKWVRGRRVRRLAMEEAWPN